MGISTRPTTVSFYKVCSYIQTHVRFLSGLTECERAFWQEFSVQLQQQLVAQTTKWFKDSLERNQTCKKKVFSAFIGLLQKATRWKFFFAQDGKIYKVAKLTQRNRSFSRWETFTEVLQLLTAHRKLSVGGNRTFQGWARTSHVWEIWNVKQSHENFLGALAAILSQSWGQFHESELGVNFP